MSIKIDHLSFTYLKKTPNAVKALDDISLEIKSGSFNAIVGETGSGKSTLIQMFNALLIPDNGEVKVDDFVITNNKHKNKHIKELRKHIGLVFQFPEYQLFEETVLKDVAFGLINYGMNKEEAYSKAKEALSMVGLGEEYYERSPFELSGGKKRRAAIASILAMEPDILVLDEPTAGLDPIGEKQILSLLEDLHQKGKTIILVTHDMDLVLKYAEVAYVLHHGKLLFEGSPSKLFEVINDEMAIEVPPLYKLAKTLKAKGFSISLEDVHSVNDLINMIKPEVVK